MAHDVNGIVEMTIRMNVYDLETEAVEIDCSGKLRITDGEQFFQDWIDSWVVVTGELLGATAYRYELNEDEF